MKEKFTYAAWAGLYILCAGLGFIPHPEGVGKLLLQLTSIIFFLPGFYLLYLGKASGRKRTVTSVRTISIVSLSLTLIMLVANFMSVTASATAGKILYNILILVSAPMICSQYWVLSLFLWACLLMASFSTFHKKG